MEQEKGKGISQLFSSTDIVTRRIEFHVARQADAHSTALTDMEPLNAPFLTNGGGPSGGKESPGMKGSGAASLPASKNGPGNNKEPSAAAVTDVKLKWPAVRKIGAGLSNLGNTCFLNSVLQCLTYTPPLAIYLESGQHRASCKAVGFCALCVMENHVKKALASHGQVIAPRQMVQNLRCIGKSFRPQRQEDAHEFARYLIEAMQRSSLPSGTTASSKASERTMLFRIFGGRLCSQVKCTKCSFCSNTFDPFLDLSLEVMHANSLLKALRRFTATEVLDGANKYKCSACKAKVQASKRLTIEKVPDVLTVQFKRFDGAGAFGGKIDKHISFDTNLDLAPFLTNTQHASSAKYSLYGVLVHAGATTHSGHYYCFVRSPAGLWHAMDDSRVRQMSEQAVLNQNAYMLFYVREPERPPPPPRPPSVSPKVPASSQTVVAADAPSPRPLFTAGVAPAKSPPGGSANPNLLSTKAALENGNGPIPVPAKAVANAVGAGAQRVENGLTDRQHVVSASGKDGAAKGLEKEASSAQRNVGNGAVEDREKRDCNGGRNGSAKSEEAVGKGEKAKKRKAEQEEELFMAEEEEEEMQRRTASSSTSTSGDEGGSCTSRRRMRQNKCLWDFHYSQIWPPKNSLMRLLSVNPRTRRFFSRWRNRSLRKRLRKLASFSLADMSPDTQPMMTRAARRAAVAADTEIGGPDAPSPSPPKNPVAVPLADEATAELARPGAAKSPSPKLLNGFGETAVRSQQNGDAKRTVTSPEKRSKGKEAVGLENGGEKPPGKTTRDSREDRDEIMAGQGEGKVREDRAVPRINGAAASKAVAGNGGVGEGNAGVHGLGVGGRENGKAAIGNGGGARDLEDDSGEDMELGKAEGEGGANGSKKAVRVPFQKPKGGALYGVAVSTWGEGDVAREKDVRLLTKSDQVPRQRLDEWDMEYDRGKTKKVKRKALDEDDAVQANPFQRVAESKGSLKSG